MNSQVRTRFVSAPVMLLWFVELGAFGSPAGIIGSRMSCPRRDLCEDYNQHGISVYSTRAFPMLETLKEFYRAKIDFRVSKHSPSVHEVRVHGDGDTYLFHETSYF